MRIPVPIVLSLSVSVSVSALVLAATPIHADVAISGLADFVVRNGQNDVTNVNFRPTSNLDMTRTRLFLDTNVDEGIQFFTQFVASGYNDFFIYSAYLRFEELGGSPLNLHAGLIPSTVGNWGPRTYSDRNPLVGIPLLWNHHTTLSAGESQTSVEALRAARDTRNRHGLPILYDNCWNTGLELWGQAGPMDWSIAMLSGSTSLPKRERTKDVPQGTARVAWGRNPSFVVGVSGWAGPYLPDDSPVLAGRDTEDFLNAGGGLDLSWTHRRLEVHSEIMHTTWEHPNLPRLGATSGYLEAKHKLFTRWYAAGRFEAFEPTEVRDSSGTNVKWDYAVRRVEAGVGFRVARRATLKAVTQVNRFQGAPSLGTEHYVLQVVAGF